MGIKGFIKKAGGKAADAVAKLSVLSPEQLRDMQERREEYLNQVPSMDDTAAEELTKRLLAASSIEIYNEYLQHIRDMYVPVKREIEYDGSFSAAHNIRFFNITKWVTDKKENSLEICSYLRELRHPLFGLSPALTTLDSEFNAYPPVITAATSLSGKELAYSLNFPQKSVAGLPVIECAEFGRNVVSYVPAKKEDRALRIGDIYHMNRAEGTSVLLTKKSLCSHTFITGSTGSGKSNTVYQILNEALEQDTKFLVIEPAKGEYKHVFGNESDVTVYGTNPYLSLLLRLNPFSFPEGVHIFEHLDRLVEIFNVCWPKAKQGKKHG